MSSLVAARIPLIGITEVIVGLVCFVAPVVGAYMIVSRRNAKNK
jgi:hypothetical protein